MDTVDLDNQEDKEIESDAESLQPDWENPPTVSDIRKDLTGVDNDHKLAVERIDTWLDYYHARGVAKPAKQEGRSNYVPKLIRKQAEWRYASLAEPFLSNSNLFDGLPRTWEDQEGAELHKQILNYQFETFIDKTKFINKYVRHSVDRGTIILKAGWVLEEEEYTEQEQVINYRVPQTEEDIAHYQQIVETYRSNPSGFLDSAPEHMKKAVELSQKQNRPVIGIPTGEFREVTKVRRLKNHPTVEICNYNDVTIDSNCGDDEENAGFICHRRETSLADLKKDGNYYNLDKIDFANLGEDIVVASERLNKSTFNYEDNARKRIYMREYWGDWDIDGNGILVPIVATFVGNTMIGLEENPYDSGKHPFIFVQHLPVDESVYGEPDGELIKDDQTLLGAFMRGVIDTMARTATGQKGSMKNSLDRVNKSKWKSGDDFEFNHDVNPEQAFYTQNYPELPQSVMIMMDNLNNDADSFTGVKSFGSTGVSGQALGSTATGVRSALDATAKRDLDILRRLANGLVKLGRKFVEMNRQFLEDNEVVRISNNAFTKINRSKLTSHIDLTLTVNTAESDNQKIERLAFMMQTMGNNGDMGLIKQILSEMFKLEKMPHLAKKVEEFEPQPDPIEQEKRQLENEKTRKEIQKIDAEILEKMGKDRLNEVQAAKNSAELIDQASGRKHAQELEKHRAQSEGNKELEILKAKLNPPKTQTQN